MQSISADLLGCRTPRLSPLKRRASSHRESHIHTPHAVAAPVETPEDVERQKLAKQTGYRSIGKELPSDVTLSQIVRTLPPEVFKIDDWKAWRAVAISIGAVTASVALLAESPWYLLPFAYLFAGTAATGLFVIGHDCGHRSFSNNKLLEDVVGTLVFAPLIYPFEPWRIKHNAHHAHTNKLSEDTAWHPVMEGELKEFGPIQRFLLKVFLGSPLKSWASVGHWLIYHFDKTKYTESQMPRVIVSWLAVAAFAGGVLPWIGFQYGWTAVVKYWLLPWLGYHFWMSTFTVVHHTAPHIAFNSSEDWNPAKAQLSGSVHCDYPGWVDFLTHDISWHVPHHVSSKIPWYNLRKATESLRENWGAYMTECTYNWKVMKTIFTELHVYNPEQNYVPFDHKKENWFLKLQRALLPETA